VNSLIPALLAGNTVILKPSPQTPLIANHIQSIFTEAGLPKNVIQTCQIGSFTHLETLIRSPEIKLICFTGSVAVGIQVQAAAADRIVNVGLELGGKDPAYIRGDVDVGWAAEEIVDGSVFNSGQSCCAVERVYVHESIYDEFVEKVKSVLKRYKVGDPFDKNIHVGPVISKRAKETVERHITDAVDKGAKDETPDNETFVNMPPDGNFVKPTLLTGVSHEMLVMTEETFGPVIPVMKVKSDTEAIKYMNDSEFGLTASIWTKDAEKGEELAEEVEAGTVFVNRCDFPSPVSVLSQSWLSTTLTRSDRTWHGQGGRTPDGA
jgi:acyl-CoA reductase-like NAD-dependent aldehyde dehydrogenase